MPASAPEAFGTMTLISPDEIVATPVADLVALVSETRVLDAGEEQRLTARSASGQDDALEALVRSHLRVAVDEAIRNRGFGERQDRLARVGALALVEAAPDFDPDEHGSFSSYARQVIRRAIKDALVS